MGNIKSSRNGKPSMFLKIKRAVLSNTIILGIIASLTGFGKTESVLTDSLLYQASVVTFDNGSKEVARSYEHCNQSSFNHYVNIITGEIFSDKVCFWETINGQTNHKYNIVSEEPISKYLSKEEISKANNKELTEEDILEIVTRIISTNSEEEYLTK